MKRSERFQPVSRIAGHAEQKAARKLASTRNQLQDLVEKLEAMKACRTEYQRKQGSTRSRVHIKELQRNQVFLKQLDEAIRLLEKQVCSQYELTHEEQKKWVGTWKYMNSLNRAIGNLRTREKQEKERREQGLLDEHALYTRSG
ncbi:MAG: flagellar export protein FliJ [Gammaproteobacteria bacterium]|nr:flagellar export protein FliJ [Gammaproteobacteria bacterium]